MVMDDFYNVPNPKKIKLHRQGKYTGYLADSVFLGATNGALPPGSTSKKILNVNGGATSVPLRENQKEIFESIKDMSSSLIEARTGGGKTVLACALCEYWNTNTLIVVHSRDMIKQFGDEIKKFINITPGEYYSSKKKLEKITITTTKSFIQHYDVFKDYGFNNLIRDEADLEFTERQRNALTLFPAIRKVGMTGTTRTEFDDYMDGSPALCRFYGTHVEMVVDEETPLQEVYYRLHNKKYEDENKIPYTPQSDWIKFREQLDNDEERKNEMVRYILQNVSPEDHCLVLFDRVWDVEAFSKWFKKGRPEWNIGMLHGSVATKLREKRIASFRKNGGILFAQEKVAGRGFNVVKINKCFIMFPCKSETNLRQIIGRAIRPFLDKNSFIYTWTDSSLLFQHKKREKTIKEFFPGIDITKI